MAALRRLITQNPNHSSLIPSTLLISRRGIASKLFVGGISFHTTEKGLLDAFSQYGQVMEAKIITDRVSDKSKGFGFVTYASEDEAEKAIAQMNGKVTAVGRAAILAAIQRYVPALIPSTYGPERLDPLRQLEKVKEIETNEVDSEENVEEVA